MLEKQNLNINFAQGLDTKTDPKQIQPGKFLSLSNTVFTTGNLLTKRNGYGQITTISDASTVTTYNDNLVALGDTLQAFSNGQLVNSGFIQPLSLDVEPIVRRATSQTTVDVAVATNGLCCSTWLDSNGSSYYQISDSVTGQTIVPAVQLPSTATMSRTFFLGRYFVVTYLATVAAAPHFQYIAIPVMNPSSPLAAQDIATTISSITAAYDGIVANNNIYFAWNASDGGGAIRIAYLTSTLGLSSVVVIAGQSADLISVTADTSGSNAVIWISFYKSGTSTIKTHAYSSILVSILATTTVVSSITINELTSVATSNVLTVFYEVSNTYTFSSVKTDYISKNTCTIAGSVGSPSIVLRGVGLASKAGYANSSTYMLVTYGQTYQPTYFLIDSTGNVIAKLAYSNGGGYLANQILSGFNVTDQTIQIGYLFKDLLAAVNKTQGEANTNGVYSQTGINLASFTLNSTMQSAEIAGDLHITGGFLWLYDGVKPVEHGFQVWPEDLLAVGSSTSGSMIPQQYFYQGTYEWTDNQGNIHRSAPSVPLSFILLTAPANFTGDIASGSAVVINVSSIANLQVGQHITGTGIPASTFILSIDSATQITMTANGTASNSGVTISVSSVTSAKINFPTLRQTYKTSNKVRLVLYRWSTAQQNYYRVTSISSPILNDPSVDSVSITDISSDAQILGNDLIYTTGGVIENIAPPACSGIALFKSRVMLINAENKNEIWYSKQVIQNTPAEFSDLFTIFVAPTTGAQGSTGDLTIISAMDDKFIAYKKDAIYYVTGTGPDNTGANNDFSDPVFITSTVGSENPNIVFMPDGLMFQSDKGIWLLGRGLQTTYIGAPVEGFNSQLVTSAVSVPSTNQVRFTLDDRATLMYDYYYQQWGTFLGLPAISSCIYQGLHTFLNQNGQVLKETPGSYVDISEPVLISFTTGWINLAGLQGFERAYFFYLLGKYLTPHKLTVSIAYDYNPPSQSVIINPTNFSGAYGSDTLYGGSTYGGLSNREQWRVFFEQQKCQAFQITLTESYDSTFGVPAGAGLTLSGLDLIVGIKDGKPRLQASDSVG